MEDDKILKEIRDSAEQVEVPESLRPEKIQETLERLPREEMQETASAPGRMAWLRRYGGMAAAILVLLTALALFQPRGGEERNEEKEALEEELLTEGSLPEKTLLTEDATKESPSEAEAGAGEEDLPEGEASGSIRHIRDYQELYDLIGREVLLEETAVMNTDMLYAGAVGEDGAAMEEAVTNDTTESGAGFREAGQAEYSRTNIQEKGVEEADIVKTDGTYLYALGNDGVLRILSGRDLELTASLDLESSLDGQVKEMYLEGDLLQVISTSYTYTFVEETITMIDGSETRAWTEVPVRRTKVENIDVSHKEAPKKTGAYQQDGNYLTSRRNGGCLYLFTSYSPRPGKSYEAKEAYVPRVGGELLPCEEIYLMGEEKGLYGGRSYLVAGALKDGETRAADRMAVVGGGEEFYVSQKNIYAASGLWENGKKWTSLIRFGYREGAFAPGRVKRIEGYLNDNFSMDEYEDHLRLVVTGEGGDEGGFTSMNHLYVLDMDLEVVGSIQNLAAGETIQSARFMGDVGYFVTYRNMDPLFSADLSDPENPRILGELKITGFSQYLHFYGKDRLLGVGWETDPDTGEQLGLKCSIFDISDPSDVKEREKLVLKDVYGCRALSNYKEFLVDPEKNIFGFAYQLCEKETWEEYLYYGVFSYDEEAGFGNNVYLRVSEAMAGTYEDYASLRGLYIGDTFYLVGAKGAEAYDMENGFAQTDSLFW
ncbi:MAG: beta-propeller domain-containing protein [Eubacteriales bacterium]|nr:beta-propeller domain-containing protein [Eubacteriales bacterium]